MKKIIVLCLLSICCAWPAFAKARNVMASQEYKTQEVFTVSPFTKLFVSGQTEVNFTQGPEGTYTVSFVGPHNLAELVDINSENGTLSVRYKEPIVVLGDQHLRVHITAPNLERIEVKDSGEVDIHEPFQAQDLEIVADGKSDVELDEVQAQAVRVALSGNAEVEFDKLICQSLQVTSVDGAKFDAHRTDCEHVIIDADNRSKISLSGLDGKTITATNSHASETELKGKVEVASLTARDRSEINASSLQAENADVMAGRAAHIGVRVAGTLNAQTQGRGTVEYKGWPLQINRTGSGTVKADR